MGLSVVSSNVGGIPEVLPAQLASLANPTVLELTEKLQKTINQVRIGQDRNKIAELAATRYNWKQICDKTQDVYR
jgi:phosphatidylinositol glycan class A protein